MISPHRLLVCVLISSLGMLPAAVAEADTPLAASSNPVTVSAYGGTTAWSEYDEETGRYRLALRIKGETTYPKVATRKQAFDVSLGPDRKGRTVALYSRCKKDDETSGCDIYRYDLRAKKETGVGGASRIDEDEVWPAQWRSNFTFVRVKYSGGSAETDRCDRPYWRKVSRKLGTPTVAVPFDGQCGVITGQAFRGSNVVTALAKSTYSELRLASIRKSKSGKPKKSKVLVKRTFDADASDLYGSPVLDGKYVYATRTGKGPTPRFVRIRRDSGSRKEVEAQTVLTGSVARLGSRMAYVEAQGASQGDPCAPITPCRIMLSSADPFSSKSRSLAPRLTLAPPPQALFGNQAIWVTGSLTTPIVKQGKVTRTEAINGMPVRILRADYSPTPTGQFLRETPAQATTGRDGTWGLTVPPPLPPFGYYSAVTRGSGIPSQSALVVLRTSAVVTLDASPRAIASGASVTFTGTVSPVQSGRTVNILLQYAPGVTESVAQPPVAPDGSFSATVALKAGGSYIADLPANPNDGSDGNATYLGTSAPVPITISP